MNADGSGQRRLTRNGARSVAPAWSPDGQRIAFERLGDVYVIDADGTGERRLSQIGTHPSWSPDGQKIAFEMNAVLDDPTERTSAARRAQQDAVCATPRATSRAQRVTSSRFGRRVGPTALPDLGSVPSMERSSP